MDKIKKKFYKKWWFWLIVVVIAIAVMTGESDETQDTQHEATIKQMETVADKSAEVETVKVIQISATELLQEYKANQVAADNKYKNKLLEVTGIIDSIGKDILDTPFITLSNQQEYSFDNVQIMFSKKDSKQLVDLQKGQVVTVQGEVDSKLLNIILKKGKIIK